MVFSRRVDNVFSLPTILFAIFHVGLAQENRGPLLELITGGVLPSTLHNGLGDYGFTPSQFEDLLNRILAGERPFEDWMRAHGHSDQDIAEIYPIIDQWLIEHGLIPPPADSSLH